MSATECEAKGSRKGSLTLHKSETKIHRPQLSDRAPTRGEWENAEAVGQQVVQALLATNSRGFVPKVKNARFCHAHKTFHTVVSKGLRNIFWLPLK